MEDPGKLVGIDAPGLRLLNPGPRQRITDLAEIIRHIKYPKLWEAFEKFSMPELAENTFQIHPMDLPWINNAVYKTTEQA